MTIIQPIIEVPLPGQLLEPVHRIDIVDWQGLAQLYLEAPTTPIGVDHDVAHATWREAAHWFGRQAQSLQASGLKVSEVDDPEPYPTSAEQLVDIDQGRYSVSTRFCEEHPFWAPEENVNYRICHDVLGHWGARSSFDRFGEVAAFRSQATHTPKRIWDVLFCETIAQLAPAIVDHQFGEQKAVLVFGENNVYRKATANLFTACAWD